MCHVSQWVKLPDLFANSRNGATWAFAVCNREPQSPASFTVPIFVESFDNQRAERGVAFFHVKKCCRCGLRRKSNTYVPPPLFSRSPKKWRPWRCEASSLNGFNCANEDSLEFWTFWPRKCECVHHSKANKLLIHTCTDAASPSRALFLSRRDKGRTR